MSRTALETFALIGKLTKKRNEKLTRLVATTFGIDEAKLAAKLAGQKGAGPAPVLNVSPLPDFNDIYYHPDDHPDTIRERQADAARRSDARQRNREKFGLHGVDAPEPELRFDPADYVLSVRAKKNDRSVDNTAAPTPPKVEGREVSGTRYVVSARDLASAPKKTR